MTRWHFLNITYFSCFTHLNCWITFFLVWLCLFFTVWFWLWTFYCDRTKQYKMSLFPWSLLVLHDKHHPDLRTEVDVQTCINITTGNDEALTLPRSHHLRYHFESGKNAIWNTVFVLGTYIQLVFICKNPFVVIQYQLTVNELATKIDFTTVAILKWHQASWL